MGYDVLIQIGELVKQAEKAVITADPDT